MGKVTIGIEDTPFTTDASFIVSMDGTEAEIKDVVDRLLASDYVTNRLTNTPHVYSLTEERGVPITYP